MSGSAPRSPDPAQTAAAQTQINQDTAQFQQGLNMVNQYNPYGSVTYEQTGTRPDGSPIYSQNTTLSGLGAGLNDLATSQLAGMQGQLSQPFQSSAGPIQTNVGQAGAIGGGYNTNFSGNLGPNYTGNVNLATSFQGADNFSADRDAYTQALLARNAGNRQQQEAQLRTTLANKGIRENSAAWNAEMEREARQNTDEQYAAILAGGQEQARMAQLAQQAAQFGNDATLAQAGFGNTAALNAGQFGSAQQQAQNAAALAQGQFANNANLTNAQFNNQAVGQQFTQDQATRNQGLSELGGVLGLATGVNPGNMSPAAPQTAVGVTDYSGLAQQDYTNRLNAYQSQLGGMGGLFGSVLGAAGQAGGFGALFSDRRLKTDITRVGSTDAGTPIYTYRYITGGPVHMGVMAQDVPHAAIEHESGYLMVDYSEVH